MTHSFPTRRSSDLSYMRMVRVSELAQGWQWFDDTIARANAPYGDVLHWTRPFDLLILLLALPAGFVLEAEQALYLAGMIVSPLLQLATALLLIWALRPVIRPEVWFLPAVALRSEEHTSELQSLMRISYAVFCLKK